MAIIQPWSVRSIILNQCSRTVLLLYFKLFILWQHSLYLSYILINYIRLLYWVWLNHGKKSAVIKIPLNTARRNLYFGSHCTLEPFSKKYNISCPACLARSWPLWEYFFCILFFWIKGVIYKNQYERKIFGILTFLALIHRQKQFRLGQNSVSLTGKSMFDGT